MADKKISQLTAATTPLAGTEVLPIVQSSATVKVSAADITAGRAVSMASGTVSSGNLTFSSTGQRLTGDMSNATVANRFAVQNSVTNGNSTLTVLPNGTSQVASCLAYNNSDPTNSSFMGVVVTSTEARLQAGQAGTGTYLPISVYVNGASKWQFDTSSNLVQKVASAGLNFTANTPAAGMTSQLLNWYEEGTWTPTYYGAAGSAGSLAYAEQTGKYTRIGRQVTVTGTIILSNKGSWTGRIQIGGFPFTPTADQYTGQVELRNVTFTGDYVIMEIGRASTSFARFVIVSGSGANTQVEDTNVANNSGFLFTLTYMV